MSSKSPHIPPPCEHDPIRLSNSMTVFGSPGMIPAEFKCSKCDVRWFVDEPTPWPDTTIYTTQFTDGAGTQMGIDIP